MSYIVDPTDPTQPTGDKGATQGDDELRALKGYIATLAGLSGGSLAVNVFRKNLIIGGDFDTNPWQRGIVFAAVGVQYTADRFEPVTNGGNTSTVSRAADAPILGTVYKNKTMDIFAINSFLLNTTAAQAGVAAGDNAFIHHPIEGYNFRPAAQIPLVLSFWHKHTKVGTYCVAFGNSGVDRSYVAEYQQVVSNTWEFDSIAIPASPSGGTWNYNTGVGLSIRFIRHCGSTFQTAPNIWQVGNFLATVNQVNSDDTNGNNFQLALIQLEVGTLPSKFERRTFQEELLLCQRYYEKSFAQIVTPAQNVGNNSGELCGVAGRAGAGPEFLICRYKVDKRTAPTITTFNPGATNAQVRDISLPGDCSAVAVTLQSATEFVVQATGNAGTAVGDILSVHWTAEAEL